MRGGISEIVPSGTLEFENCNGVARLVISAKQHPPIVDQKVGSLTAFSCERNIRRHVAGEIQALVNDPQIMVFECRHLRVPSPRKYDIVNYTFRRVTIRITPFQGSFQVFPGSAAATQYSESDHSCSYLKSYQRSLRRCA